MVRHSRCSCANLGNRYRHHRTIPLQYILLSDRINDPQYVEVVRAVVRLSNAGRQCLKETWPDKFKLYARYTLMIMMNYLTTRGRDPVAFRRPAVSWDHLEGDSPRSRSRNRGYRCDPRLVGLYDASGVPVPEPIYRARVEAARTRARAGQADMPEPEPEPVVRERPDRARARRSSAMWTDEPARAGTVYRLPSTQGGLQIVEGNHEGPRPAVSSFFRHVFHRCSDWCEEEYRQMRDRSRTRH